MLERIAPHLATIGVHKNGTWAAQKIIECSSTDEERAIVVNNLRPFAPPLMCDSLGNYVCAGTLRFGEPFNHYVFDAMIDRMWDIAQNRFGARCMRTCLESPYTSLYQKVKPGLLFFWIGTEIVLNSLLNPAFAETNFYQYYPEFYPFGHQSQWCPFIDLAGGFVESPGQVQSVGEQIHSPYCSSLHP